jgi:hypothetical protein
MPAYGSTKGLLTIHENERGRMFDYIEALLVK